MRFLIQLTKTADLLLADGVDELTELSLSSLTLVMLLLFLLTGGALLIAASIPRARASRLMEEGNNLILAGAEQDGLELMRQAIAIQPKSIEFTRHLSYAYAAVGNREAAISYQRRILRLEPDNPDALYDIARLYESV